MPTPRFEVLDGDIDGVNTIFTAPSAYIPGTLALFFNGTVRRKDYDDGFIESNPSTGEVTTKESPKVGDVLQAFYLDTSVTTDTTELSPLQGSIAISESITAELIEIRAITGTVMSDTDLVAVLQPEDQWLGNLEEVTQIVGLLGEATP